MSVNRQWLRFLCGFLSWGVVFGLFILLCHMHCMTQRHAKDASFDINTPHESGMHEEHSNHMDKRYMDLFEAE